MGFNIGFIGPGNLQFGGRRRGGDAAWSGLVA